ncbi:MAG: glycosyltransferase family 4 protein [Candidatus Zambryskibacteria bacterium]|nr:glycosyltransferase family 4 protein [Candidatus Zambryskibacteria bacterium]
MKLIYISPLRYPSEKAGSLFSVKSCEAFAKEGIEVELWVPLRRNNLSKEDVFKYFGVEKNFKIRYFFTLDLINIFSKGFYLLSFSFAISVFLYSIFLKMFGKIGEYVFYSHEQVALLFLTYFSKRTFYEAHDFPEQQKKYNLFFKRITGTISTNHWKTKEFTKRFNLSENRILTVPNAVDLKYFSNNLSKKEARYKLNLPEAGYLVGYVGTLKTMGMEKGVATAIDSLKFLSADYKLYIVGGEQKDIDYYKAYAKELDLLQKVIFVGNVPHIDISLHMSACDYLIAPYPNTEHYSHYMSPMKMFEYMASGRPIIATDLPSIREILSDKETAILVAPGLPEALAGAVEGLTNDSQLAQTLAETAYGEVKEKYTWERRAKKVLEFVKLKNG